MTGIRKIIANIEIEIEVFLVFTLAYNLSLSEEQASHIAFRQLMRCNAFAPAIKLFKISLFLRYHFFSDIFGYMVIGMLQKMESYLATPNASQAEEKQEEK